MSYFRRSRSELCKLLGESCRCCGSTVRLQIDHVVSVKRGSIKLSFTPAGIAQIKEHIDQFQLLCADCNRWKDNGPCCPCKWWDTVKPGWREATVTPDRNTLICKMYRSGESIHAVGAAFNLSAQAISNVLKKKGIATRPQRSRLRQEARAAARSQAAPLQDPVIN